jgi:hypothetical protein
MGHGDLLRSAGRQEPGGWRRSRVAGEDAAHFYRHEAGHEEPVQPPLTLAVQMVSHGATFLRWLAEMDATLQGS